MFYVYVLENTEGRLYIGSTADLEKRVQAHQQGEAGWTRSRGPWELVYHESFGSRSEATKRERELKGGRVNQELREYLRRNSG